MLGDQILKTCKAAKIAVLPVPTPEWPEWDGKIFVRSITSLELDTFLEDADEEKNERARFAVIVACDADGNRIFGAAHARELGDLEGALPVVERIWWQGRKFAGLTDESRRLEPKNSVAAGTAGSPSSLPACVAGGT